MEKCNSSIFLISKLPVIFSMESCNLLYRHCKFLVWMVDLNLNAWKAKPALGTRPQEHCPHIRIFIQMNTFTSNLSLLPKKIHSSDIIYTYLPNLWKNWKAYLGFPVIPPIYRISKEGLPQFFDGPCTIGSRTSKLSTWKGSSINK